MLEPIIIDVDDPNCRASLYTLAQAAVADGRRDVTNAVHAVLKNPGAKNAHRLYQALQRVPEDLLAGWLHPAPAEGTSS